MSNFTVVHLKELLSQSPVTPAVNQVEFNPFLYQKELLDFCKQNNIQLQSYCPLCKGKKLQDKSLQDLSQKYNKTPAQILIRWALEHNVVVIPKSVKQARIEENANVFDFSIEHKDLLTLDKLNQNLRLAWDPTNVP